MRAMPPAAGFSDPVLGAQAAFRCLLEAIAHPGRIVPTTAGLVAATPLLAPTYAAALSLFDFETPVWLDPPLATPAVRDTLRLHCGCPFVSEPGQASFALLDANARTPLAVFAAGTPEYPDRSATLIWQVEELTAGDGVALTGPGIRASAQLHVGGLPDDFWVQWGTNHGRYPLGVDVVFVTADRIAALPRSIEVRS